MLMYDVLCESNDNNTTCLDFVSSKDISYLYIKIIDSG